MYKLHYFSSDISNCELPKQFTFPFNYTPHPLAKVATEELQNYLETQKDFNHDFGIDNPNSQNALGKMFGVLVVKDCDGKLGYLAAFSGKLAESTQHSFFVPPIYDILVKDGFYRTTENELNKINKEIESIENNSKYINIKRNFELQYQKHNSLLATEKQHIKTRQKTRKQTYKALQQSLSEEEITSYQNKLNQLKINESFYLREYEVYLNDKLYPLKTELDSFKSRIEFLKKERAQKSAWVQQEIFKNYSFLNTSSEEKNLLDIFSNTKQNIPAGAGDCSAPKLLQYAFLNNLTPICMAEFWWGKPLISSVRKHGYFYPACVGKCKPILSHMLEGLHVEENPIYVELKAAKEIEIIYEDDTLAVINKPVDLLSVSGTEIEDSVYTRMKKRYPNATGPLIVHRLDMSTSGILLIAKTKEAHHFLQDQFKDKTIQKRYVALLDGVLSEKKGEISLPLKVDFHYRPKQMVCFDKGKKALTKWKTVEVINGKTKVYFYPITGRTHQLRMHAAHHLGLNTPIVGDDLYGKKTNRLHLHAEYIAFIHPKTKKQIEFMVKSEF
ncbi:Ribosomal large subunit pseudouridine synthase A [Tenacibaculum sp. 190130A14a]|uniref:tRNA pseudouridine32 synthase / 23S rRNA pseudouridine746 synthase n=1 Tax=Tenacibaculum polynesiense TaxID=3137857 RepID=A0ABM9PFX8_9FLAO